jgi:hypothetical protein
MHYGLTSAEKRHHWLFTLLVGLAGFYILKQHLFYLEHLNPAEWGRKYLQANRANPGFHEELARIKTVISLTWIGMLALCLYHTQAVLLQKQVTPNKAVLSRMLVAGIIFILTVVNYDPPDIDLAIYFFSNSVGFAAIVYAIYHLRIDDKRFEWLGRIFIWLRRVPNYALCAAAVAFVLYITQDISLNSFRNLPLTVDTSAQWVHAKMMAMGKWYMKSPPIPEFHTMYMMINNGKWYSQYPPGHVMVLAIGQYFKMVKWVNPILGALTCLAAFLLAKELYGRRVARITVVLCAVCAYLIMFSSEFMSNATSLLTGTVFLWAYFRVLHRPHWLMGAIGGAAIGYCTITRPYSSLALAAPAIIYALYMILTEPREYLKPFMTMGAMGACFVGFLLYYNHVTNGDPFTFGYQNSWGNWHNPLTSEAAEKLTSNELLKNYRENMQRTGWYNRILFEWPIPTLILAAIVLGFRGGRRDEKILLCTILSIFASCQVLPGNVEIEWGPRLTYEVLTILVILCAKGVAMLPAVLRSISMERHSLRYYYGFAVILLTLFYGYSFKHSLRMDVVFAIYNLYNRGTNPKFFRYIVNHVKHPALVFVHPNNYEAVSFTNPPREHTLVVFVQDLGPRNHELLKYYPGRNYYTAAHTTAGYVVQPFK